MDPDGRLAKLMPVDLPEAVLMHDFAITANYALFLDCPLGLDGERMVKQGTVPLRFKKERGARVGLLPLDADNAAAVRWFELPPFMIFHTVNAWEEAGKVKVSKRRVQLVVLCSYSRNFFWGARYDVALGFCFVSSRLVQPQLMLPTS